MLCLAPTTFRRDRFYVAAEVLDELGLDLPKELRAKLWFILVILAIKKIFHKMLISLALLDFRMREYRKIGMFLRLVLNY